MIETMHTIYRAIHRATGAFYIGATKHTMHRRRYYHRSDALKGKGGSLLDLIREFGIEAIDFEEVAKVETPEEARELERKLIDDLRPPLNRNRGGGSIGYDMSAEGRAKIAASSRGKRYAAGHKHTDYFKDFQRELGLARRDEFMAKAQAKGVEHVRKAVVCLDDGRTFPSIAAAAKHYGINYEGVAEVVRGARNRVTVGGLRFAKASN